MTIHYLSIINNKKVIFTLGVDGEHALAFGSDMVQTIKVRFC